MLIWWSVTLRKRKDDWESVTTSHPDYIRFYNSLWLVANDVIIGIALGSYIIDNSAWVAESISGILSMYSIAALRRTITWLMDYPAGLKLNNELAAFLGDLFLWVIDHWSSGFRHRRILDNTDICRLHRSSATGITSCHLVYWVLQLCRRQHAYCSFLRPSFNLDSAHILVLYGICSNLQLAIYHPDLPLPTVPWKEIQCATKSNWFMRLWSRPTPTRHDLVHTTLLSAAHSSCILPHICMFTHGDHIPESGLRYAVSLLKSFPAFCSYVTNKRLSKITG